MVNIVAISDDRLCLTPEGTYYGITRREWLQIADMLGAELSELRVCCRVFHSNKAASGWTPFGLNDRIRVVSLPWFHKYQVLLKTPRALSRLWRELSDSDLVWLKIPNVYPMLAYLVARLLRRPILAWCVGDVSQTALLVYNEWPIRLSYKFYSWLTGVILRNVDIAVVCSRRLGEKYCPKSKFIVASVSRLDSRYFYVREPERSLEPLTILFVGRLSPDKGVASLVEVMDTVRQVVPNVRLIIAGDGRQRGDLQDLVSRKGLQKVVEFVGWVAHGDPLLQLYREADIFCMPSYSEGLPAALLEALAASLPAVVTTAGDMPTLVGESQAGLVVPPRNSQALAHALILLLTQSDLHRQMAQNAYRVAQENTFERQTGKVVAAARELLRQRQMQAHKRKTAGVR